MNDRLEESKKIEFLKFLGLEEAEDFIFKADHIIEFDVDWVDDQGEKRVNKGYRVEWNNLNGPYKGGLRFHPSVDLNLFKNLAFEQTFKNILTTLPMGGGKGGSDFDPHNKSNEEIKRFCYAFMDKLYPYIGADKDIPAGDIGVGSKEVEYLYERYVELTGKHDCALTGKPIYLGGSLCRKEATGYGLCYIVNKCLEDHGMGSFSGKRVIVSGSGNVAIYAAEKAINLGAKVVAMSDSSNAIYDENGIDLSIIKEIKEVRKDRIHTYKNYKDAQVLETKDIWKIKCDIALPCATQNEIDIESANALINGGCKVVAEGANMPVNLEAQELFLKSGILFLPGKAANAGGVSVSGLEIIQNARNEKWDFDVVDKRLKEIMENIYTNISLTAKEEGKENNFIFGANKYSYNKLVELKRNKEVFHE